MRRPTGNRRERGGIAADDPLASLTSLTRQRRVAGLVAAAVACCVVVQSLALAATLAVGVGRGNWSDARTPAAIALMAFVVRGILMWAGEVTGRRAGSAAMRELRGRLVTAALGASSTDPDRDRTGEVATLAVEGGAAVERWAGRALLQRSLAATVPLAAIAAMAYVDWLSALIIAPTVPLLVLFMVLLGSDARRVADERLGALALLGAHMLDVLRGLPTLRAFGRARVQEEQLRIAGEAYRRQTAATLRSAFTSSFALEFIAMLGTAIVAVTAGVRLVSGSMAFETAMAVLLLAPELYVPLRNLGVEYHAAADAQATLQRVASATEKPTAVPLGTPGGPVPDPGGDVVRLEGVRVEPAGSARVILQDVDVELAPGRVTVVVGPSGSGKTTLLRLVLALQRPDRGRITCGGVPLDDVDLRRWRRRIAWVPQHPAVLTDTLAANMRLADASASTERMWEALRIARLDEWARRLPSGLETRVGDGAVRLSAGERRRLGLARAALRDARLLLIDEPTANLDSDTAALVVDSLDELTRGRTAVIVSHEEDVVRLADRMLAVEAGYVEIRETEVVGA